MIGVAEVRSEIRERDSSALTHALGRLLRAATTDHRERGEPDVAGGEALQRARGDPHPIRRVAVDFYRTVFDAVLMDATEMEGILVHAQLDFGLGLLQLGEPSPAYRLVPPPAGDEDCYSMGVYVPDTDAAVARAVAAGAVVRENAATFVSGDRYASVPDPFGLRWTIMIRVEDLSDEESARRVREWADAQG